uniref:Serine hydroxymethyltransferase 1 n=1 Tax=Anthurium amnicola TaxID=1678845 RepID=A0A1D1YPN2_9ARAE
MDWYLRRDSDDLIASNNQKTSGTGHSGDRSPSSNGWFQWEAGKLENVVPTHEFVSRSMRPIGAGLNFNWQSLHGDVELEYSLCDGEDSINTSEYGDFSLGDSCARTLEALFHKCEHLGDQPDYQLQSSMEQKDDFWESMFFEESPNMKNLSSNSMDFAYKSMSFGNLLADMLEDPHDSLKDSSFMGSTSSLERAFPPLTDDVAEDEDQMEDASPSSVADNSMSPEGSPMASVLAVLVPAELVTSKEIVSNVQEKKCLEATVLWELEDVMSELNVETRICFRDALYRLAKISKRHCSFIKDETSSEVDGESSCHGSLKSAELRTNDIDRTVANLMFNKPKSGLPGLPCPR